MTTVWHSFRDGLRRVRRAPALLICTFLLTLLVALPLAIALDGMIEQQLGASLVAEAAARGADYGWWQEFSAQASGLGTTFVPSIIGFGAVLKDVSGLLDNLPLAATIVGVTAAWLVLWSFLSGGIIDRYARDRATRTRGFFGACGAHLPALTRLALAGLAVYWWLFAYVHGWIFGRAVASMTRDVTAERTGFLIALAGYAAFGLVLAAVNVIFDYARIRLVVEDRRSALGALLASVRFLRRHGGSAAGLYAVNVLAFAGLVAVYGVVAPGVTPAGLRAWAALFVGEVYILFRHALKLTFYASETSFFQARLAHAAYTAAPPVVWPDSPAAESIANAASPERA